jgi:hypothetical protein
MNEPSQVDETELNQYQLWALEILNTGNGARLDPQCPLSMKTAMHDLWRFGMADRSFDDLTRSMIYEITSAGRERASEVLSEET